ncbi:S8 family peptidase [Paenibacillus beijingensis]|uniref:Peptidase S8/S53 domain-containing protein n=1 Tax=Paenibacillus beijingensis TaxID=1126833 RepID=A0A0D5NQH5_9BACL|nr:S8 family peptidase [Paenibacillus beijingensis]AJY77232.1 hypothetical protein VN24_25115 [Paenibacillus beijingensis]
MKELVRTVCRYARKKAGAHTERHLIVMNSAEGYDRLLRGLREAGITPLKAIRGSRMICCYLDRRSNLKSLRKHSHIKSLEKDVRVRALALNTATAVKITDPRRASARQSLAFNPRITWNISRVQAPAAWLRTRGSGIRLAIIDTGIAAHPDLHVRGGTNTIGGRSFRDDNGHGTHVAGIAAGLGRTGMPAGVAPRASLYAVKALNRNGFGNISDIVEGIDWCIRNRMDVINMSFGLQGELQGTALHDSIIRAKRRGIVLVAPAGNNGPNNRIIDLPARYPETIAVASSSIEDRIDGFSSRGAGIDLSAPGRNIVSTWLGRGYAISSGTSMASPHVAGGAALLRAKYPQLLPDGVRLMLRSRARKLPGFSARAQGAGLLQLASIAESRANDRSK